MTARAGMTSLIAQVRAKTGAGTADWADDDVQRMLDTGRTDVFGEVVTALGRPLPGSVIYDVFELRGPVETGTALVLTDLAGGTIGTASYEVEPDSGQTTFAAGHDSSQLMMFGRRFNVNAAAADLLDSWAGALAVDSWGLTQDQQTLNRAERIESMRNAAKALRGRSPARIVNVVREDG